MVRTGARLGVKAKNRTARLVMIALFIGLIIVGAYIKLPIGIVPVSMQCTVCVLAALLLGPWDSLIAVSIYLAMGLVGIPVFTAGGGFAYVLQPTFGYLLGYLFALPIGGCIARGVRTNARPNFLRMLLGGLAAIAVIYTFGVMYMYLMLNYYVGSSMEIGRAWMVGAAVFLPTDISLCVISAVIARRVVPIISRTRIASRGLAKGLIFEEYVREDEKF